MHTRSNDVATQIRETCPFDNTTYRFTQTTTIQSNLQPVAPSQVSTIRMQSYTM